MFLEEFKKMLIFEGVSDVGFFFINLYLLDELKMFKICIIVVIKFLDVIVNEIVDLLMFIYYYYYKVVNNFIDFLILKGVLFLELKGYFVMSVAVL